MSPLVEERSPPEFHVLQVVEHLQRLLLREQVNVVGVLDLVEQANDFLGGEGHAQTDGCRGPQLGEGVEDDEVGKAVEVQAEGSQVGEVGVGLINDDDSAEGRENVLDSMALEGIAGGVVGRTEPDDLGVVIGGSQQGVGIEGEVLAQGHGTILHIVDVCAYAVHPVGGSDGHDVVLTGFAEDSEDEVYGLVGAVAKEDA